MHVQKVQCVYNGFLACDAKLNFPEEKVVQCGFSAAGCYWAGMALEIHTIDVIVPSDKSRIQFEVGKLRTGLLWRIK